MNRSVMGVGAILFASLVWGTTGTVATFAPGVSPLAIGAAAMGLGGLAQAALAWRGIGQARGMLWRQRRLLGAGALAVFVYPLAFYTAMRLAGVTVGTVLALGTPPLFSALLEYLVERKRLTPQWAMGVLAGIAGTVLICTAKAPAGAFSVGGTQLLAGVVLGQVAAFAYACYAWTARRMMEGGTPSAVAMGATFGLGGLLLMPVLAFSGAAFLASWSNAAVGLYMAAVPMFLGYVAFGYGLARVPVSVATTLTLFEPVVAALLAVLVVGERLAPAGWAGVALVLGCLVIVTLPSGARQGRKAAVG